MRKYNKLPSVEYLKKLLDYDSNTGFFYWKERDHSMFSIERTAKTWNTKNSGKIAGYSTTGGYILIKMLGHRFKAHRLAWKIYYGIDPENDIDHIDGITHNNCISNLRDVTHQQNSMNSKLPSNNKSGHIGVRFNNQIDRWVARLGSKHIGCFIDKESAIEARVNAENAASYHPNHGRILDDIDFTDSTKCGIDRSLNIKPKSLQKNNKSGIIGVSKHRNKWSANITINGKRKFLGNFDTIKEAGIAVQKGKEKYT